MIRKILSITATLVLTGGLAHTAIADDNVAACEIVVQQPVESAGDDEEALEGTPMMATFIPAADFIFSVFDDEPGHMSEFRGHPIKALMCQRRYLVPTEFDLRLIETRIPLYLSQDFDSQNSDLMAVFFEDNQYQYDYSGKDLSEDGMEILSLRMKTLNAKLAEDSDSGKEQE